MKLPLLAVVFLFAPSHWRTSLRLCGTLSATTKKPSPTGWLPLPQTSTALDLTSFSLSPLPLSPNLTRHSTIQTPGSR
jgi:hypothetical protein